MWVLIAGALVLAFELASGSFYLLWYGLGLVISGAAGLALGYDDWLVQSVIGLGIGLCLMLFFRKRLYSKMLGRKIKDEFLLEEGEGVIKDDGLVEFRGTVWRYKSANKDDFAVGERVVVKPTQTNTVIVEKII